MYFIIGMSISILFCQFLPEACPKNIFSICCPSSKSAVPHRPKRKGIGILLIFPCVLALYNTGNPNYLVHGFLLPALCLVGYIDDRFEIRFVVRAGAMAVLLSIALFAGLASAIACLAFFILYFIINQADGANGSSSLMIASLFVVSWIFDDSLFSDDSIFILGALMGYFICNFFLDSDYYGESGIALFLGYFLFLHIPADKLNILLPAVLGNVWVWDVLITACVVGISGNIWEGHTSHFYQRNIRRNGVNLMAYFFLTLLCASVLKFN